MVFDIRDFGAIGDGKTLNTFAIQKAIDECAEKGGGRVLLENGIYMTGTIIMRSFVELHIAANAVLLGSPDCADYPEHETKHVESRLLPRWRNACLIYADECENIALTGQGTIDCNGTHFVRKVEPEETKVREVKDIDALVRELPPEKTKTLRYIRYMDRPTPPRCVFFTGCKNVKVEDIMMINQPAGWSYWIHDCDYVTFDKVKINASLEFPNNDGIHINSSRNVTISNCSISCCDDCIIVRANNVSLKENKVCERVVVTNCNLTSYASGIRVGWINDGVIRNCTFSNIVMTDTSAGINIMLPLRVPSPDNPSSSDIGREDTLIENLTFSNVMMGQHCGRPVQITIHEDRFVRCNAIRNIYFNNIHAKGPMLPNIAGREENHIENIWFNDCSFTCTDGGEIPNRDCHGCGSGIGVYPMAIRHADVKFNNTTISML